jgi:hypothetical protein
VTVAAGFAIRRRWQRMRTVEEVTGPTIRRPPVAIRRREPDAQARAEQSRACSSGSPAVTLDMSLRAPHSTAFLGVSPATVGPLVGVARLWLFADLQGEKKNKLPAP